MGGEQGRKQACGCGTLFNASLVSFTQPLQSAANHVPELNCVLSLPAAGGHSCLEPHLRPC